MRQLSVLLAACAAACLALALLLAGGVVAPAPAAAQALTGAPDAEPPADEAAPPSVWQRAAAVFLAVQSTVNRTINERLVHIKREHSLAALLAGLAIAFAYGVFHALGPGHGKAVLLSYFVSREARIGRGIWMGTQIALFHVASAIVIVVVVHLVLQQAFARPVDELGFLKVASYGAIMAIGVAMLHGALRDRRARRAAEHDHGHDDGHVHHAGCGHHHDLRAAWREGGLLSFAVGLIPCSGAVLILVYCLANGLLLSGVLMAGSIALGMAITLAALGIATIYARKGAILMAARSGRPRSAVPAALGLVGPGFITLFGAVMLLGSL
jgi:ABC-type nickel/cobalt efflux system permease component RcnA